MKFCPELTYNEIFTLLDALDEFVAKEKSRQREFYINLTVKLQEMAQALEGES